jgi:transcriptional regulator with XRE-family HTH domain
MTFLKRVRLERGMSQQALGARTRIQASDLSRIERRRLVPSAGQLARLSRVLKVEEDDLLMEVEAYEPASGVR